jgi:hypothetical protein
MAVRTLKWGIVATGNISVKFAKVLALAMGSAETLGSIG